VVWVMERPLSVFDKELGEYRSMDCPDPVKDIRLLSLVLRLAAGERTKSDRNVEFSVAMGGLIS